ncbi:MAG: sodium/proline symporter [Gammaproteobacteria bacterium]
MSKAQAILLTLIGYSVALLAIGIWANRRTRDHTDFFLGGRALGPLVAAISASASSSSAWTLLGVSGAAYVWGLSALWLFPATVSGFLINWFWVGPRLMRLSHAEKTVTLTEFVAGPGSYDLRLTIMRVASAIVVFSFVFYIAAQFQAAGHAFASTFDLSMEISILIGGSVLLIYTLIGGFWAVSVTDTLQGILMAVTAIVLPLGALVSLGGFEQLLTGLAAGGDADTLSLTGPHSGFMGLAFVMGTLGIGLGYPGQPHVVNRYMALRDETALKQARVIAIGWAVIVYSGMLLLGLCARVLLDGIGDTEQAFFVVANNLLPPVVAGVMIAAVLSAIMSTADSQLLVAASSASYDWNNRSAGSRTSLTSYRVMVFVISALAILIAVFLPQDIFSRVLFAWHAVGSAFGPLVFLRIAGFDVRPGAKLATLIAGFGLTVLFHVLPDVAGLEPVTGFLRQGPGDFAERILPLLIALAIAWQGRTGR